MSVICEYRYCQRESGSKRFCCDLCRWKEWDLQHPRKRLGERTTRRASRDGHGVRLYLSKHELEELRLGPPYPMYLQRKLSGAMERIERNGTNGTNDQRTTDAVHRG